MSKKLYTYKDKINFKTSLDIGEVTPVYWNILYPGEKFEYFNFKNLTRMVPPIYPTLDNARIEYYSFAVPLRLLDPSHDPSKYDSLDSVDTALPFIPLYEGNLIAHQFLSRSRSTPITNDNARSDAYLLDKFGIQHSKLMSNNLTSCFNFDLSYLLAYYKIYEQFFRQKQVENFSYIDLFNQLTYYGRFKELSEASIMSKGVEDELKQDEIDKALKNIGDAVNTLSYVMLGNTHNSYLTELTFDMVKTDISTDWNLFRTKLFEHYERNRLTLDKKNYATIKDAQLSVWNKSNGDKTNPILLGFDIYEQTISQVTNQAKTETQALGEVGGLSLTFNECNNLINHYVADEPTIIMVIALPTYSMKITGSFEADEFSPKIPGMFFGNPSFSAGYEQQFNPEMEFIQSPRYSNFVTVDGGFNNRIILGYKPPFSYLRHKKSGVAGEVMEPSKWGSWTYSLELTKPITSINTNLLKINKKPFKETLVSPNQDSFICDYNFYTKINRTIKPEWLIEQNVIEGK